VKPSPAVLHRMHEGRWETCGAKVVLAGQQFPVVIGPGGPGTFWVSYDEGSCRRVDETSPTRALVTARTFPGVASVTACSLCFPTGGRTR
jgi:hypothetical protein